MGLFEQLPYTNFHEMNLDWLLRNQKALDVELDTIKEEYGDIMGSGLQNAVDNKLAEMLASGDLAELFAQYLGMFATPEMYGAKGDGVTDDTQAFKDALDNNMTVVCYPNKTYVIHELDITTRCNLNGLGCTIKATRLCDYIIRVSSTFNNYSGTISNMIIDGSHGATDLIRTEDTFRRQFVNLWLKNPITGGNAIHIVGHAGGCTFERIFGRNEAGATGTTFLKNDGYDANANCLDCQNFSTAVYNYSGGSIIINQLHAYVTADFFVGSQFAEIAGGTVILSNIYPDTQETIFNITGICSVIINGGQYYHNADLVPNDDIPTTITIVNGASANEIRRFRMHDIIFRPPSTITKYTFCNQTGFFDTEGCEELPSTNVGLAQWRSTAALDVPITTNANVTASTLTVINVGSMLYLTGFFTLDGTDTTGVNMVDVGALGAFYYTRQTSNAFYGLYQHDSGNAAASIASNAKLQIAPDRTIRIRKPTSLNTANMTYVITVPIPIMGVR